MRSFPTTVYRLLLRFRKVLVRRQILTQGGDEEGLSVLAHPLVDLFHVLSLSVVMLPVFLGPILVIRHVLHTLSCPVGGACRINGRDCAGVTKCPGISHPAFTGVSHASG